ncbi:hypothetical protein F4804DRAFT_315828 [Jackrogersella minutella]|nr:hypothetical protein F4804DRAFT_315828 [Jackrogersella minutella]
MLWTMFLCMVRTCIAMAWPWDAVDENETTMRDPSAPSGLVHNDFHGGNLVFGPFLDSPEHTRTPILKLLDFGLAARLKPHEYGEEGTGEQRNILDLGIMMATLIMLDTDKMYTGEEIELDLSRLNLSSSVLTPASGILEDIEMGTPDPFPNVDLNLRFIVAGCMASNPEDRPRLAELENWAVNGITRNTPDKYAHLSGGIEWETDATIHRLLRRCIFDA